VEGILEIFLAVFVWLKCVCVYFVSGRASRRKEKGLTGNGNLLIGSDWAYCVHIMCPSRRVEMVL
jgi:hypothetical protein